jgi:hypothetical protein
VPEKSTAGGDGDNTNTNAHKPGAGGTKLRRSSTVGSARDAFAARPYSQKRTAAAARPKIHSNELDVAEKPAAAGNWLPGSCQQRVEPYSGPKVEEIDSSEDTSRGHVAQSTGHRNISSSNGQTAASNGKPRVNFGTIGSPEGHLSSGMGFVWRASGLCVPHTPAGNRTEGGCRGVGWGVTDGTDEARWCENGWADARYFLPMPWPHCCRRGARARSPIRGRMAAADGSQWDAFAAAARRPGIGPVR